VSIFIGLSKGELGNDIQRYLKRYGTNIEICSRTYTQRRGNKIFRIINSRDVPRFVGKGYDFGITGKDCCEDEKLSGNDKFVYLDNLDFAKGCLVFYGSGRKVPKKPTVVTSTYYSNLAKKFSNEIFRKPEIISVKGATEGYVSSGEADVGFDCTFKRQTIDGNGLNIIEEVMPTCAVLIGAEGYEKDDFDNIVLDGGFEFEKMGGLVPAVVQDYRTGKVLMLAYMNKMSLRKTRETGLATFWSRSREELWTKGKTSGNTLKVREILKDCDKDAILLKVNPKGPACHTGNATCFYRELSK
jgi:phosphoribosyl-AMP cyclohydrolase